MRCRVNAGGEGTLYDLSIPEIQRKAVMIKLTSLALTAALGLAGVATSLPAAACPTIGVAVAGPAVAIVTPVGYYGHDRDWGREHDWGRDHHWGRDRDWHRREWREDHWEHRWH